MIRFMAPDLPQPSGGIKVIYNYVSHLNALGHRAEVWHGTPGFAYPDWESPAPVRAAPSVDFSPGDLLVVPETGGGKWSFLCPDVPVVMLCQGMDFVFSDADFLTDVPGGYPGWPQAVAALSVSEAIGTFLDRACEPGFPIHPVPVEIESYFVPRPKKRQIALMPRRRREDLLGAVQLLRRSGRLDGWEIVLLDRMTQQQVADALGDAAIFLFGAEREGFGLPGAEAMAAGCYVIGFTGDGAKEYMLEDCCDVIADSDVVDMADKTLAAIRLFDTDPAALAARAERGRARVRERHDSAAVGRALEQAFTRLTAPDSSAVFAQPARLPHYAAYGPRDTVGYRLRVAARSGARTALDRTTDLTRRLRGR